jgi:2-oxoglutarate dehydrogenase E1 component
LQVCNPTTPAQYFHLLRRQARASFRKPLVLLTPKSLLRHPQAVSSLSDLSSSTFMPVIGDDSVSPGKVVKVLLCSGKIYYQLLQRCRDIDCKDIAIVRLEQIYPFPEDDLRSLLGTFDKAEDFLWVQEEPENMGAWQFIRPRLETLLGKSPAYIGRAAAASPATGFPMIYKQQQAAITDKAVGPQVNGKDMGG